MKSFFSVFTVFFQILFIFNSAQAQLRMHGPTEEQIEQMAAHNAQMAEQVFLGPVFRNRSLNSFVEYGDTGYIVFSDDNYSGMATDIKNQIAANLPSSTQLIVYTQSSDTNHHRRLRQQYSQFIEDSRLHILQLPRSGSNDFWTRDNLPLPMLSQDEMSLTDARYYYNFEPDAAIGKLFGANVDSHSFFFEGGNFMTNSRGQCIVVNRRRSYIGGVSDTAKIPDDLFKAKYGCKTITRLQHLKGIGHADEVVKYISDDVIITDTPEYKSLLEGMGLTVHMLPSAELNYETYINSLIVNDTVFVPIFGEKQDSAVLAFYKSLGFKTVGINTRRLATQGQGSIHCITMNYPPVPLLDLQKALRAL